MRRRSTTPSSHSRTSRGRRPLILDGPVVDRLEPRVVLAADLRAVIESTGLGHPIYTPHGTTNLEIKIENVGNEAVGNSVARLVLSPDATIGDENDVTLDQFSLGPIFASGSSLFFRGPVIPGDLPPGLWFLGVIADVENTVAEDDETNNTAISGTTIVRNASDLIPLLLLNEPNPLPEPGEAIEVTFSFVNNSEFAAGAHTARVVLSPDGSFGGPDDVTLFEHEFAGIGAFGTPGFVENLLIPVDLAPGTWRLGVMADADGDLVELDEANNIEATNFDLVVVVESRPDLVPDADFNSLAIPTTAGSNLGVEFTIGNISSFVAAPSTARVVLTLDQVLGNSDDIVLNESAVGQMGTFGVTFLNPVCAIPADLAPGEWFLGIMADVDGEVNESDETNNGVISPEAAVTVAPTPNIEVLGGATGTTPILHETKASRSKGTGFGPVQEPDGTKSTLFVIFNSGNAPLTITGIEPRGQRPQDYSITQFPEETIAAGGTTAFIVQFDPTAFGTRRANIAIFTSDPDRSRFTMRIAGRGMPDPTLADVEVTGGTEPISDNDKKARPDTGQRFGAAAVGGEVVRIYTITNQGSAGVLTFTSPVIRVTGANAADFAIVGVPSAAFLAPGETTTFSIRFSPTAAGIRRATIEVLSNDPDEGVFDFKVIGTGV